MLGWGSHVGRHRRRRAARAGAAGRKVAWVHLIHLNPFPPNLGEVLRRYPKVLVPEMNLGQLCRLVRAEFLVDAKLGHQGAGPARSPPPSSKHAILKEIADE